MPARSVCLVTLSLSEALIRSWTRTLRPPGIRHRHGMVWYGMVEVCEGAPVAVSVVFSVWYMVFSSTAALLRTLPYHTIRVHV